MEFLLFWKMFIEKESKFQKIFLDLVEQICWKFFLHLCWEEFFKNELPPQKPGQLKSVNFYFCFHHPCSENDFLQKPLLEMGLNLGGKPYREIRVNRSLGGLFGTLGFLQRLVKNPCQIHPSPKKSDWNFNKLIIFKISQAFWIKLEISKNFSEKFWEDQKKTKEKGKDRFWFWWVRRNFQNLKS